ncbi:uncharacterized protein [Dysidea avara]|uniref:uncharacterized protein isoform X2 n=1 Tax=Dysidea avara TaxID=196820 RepID=UPI00331BA591
MEPKETGNTERRTENDISKWVTCLSNQFATALSRNAGELYHFVNGCNDKPVLSLLDVMESLVQHQAMRTTMKKMTFTMVSTRSTIMQDQSLWFAETYTMIKKEEYFFRFQKCYYLLYQSFDCNSTKCLQIVMQQYSVPLDVQKEICSKDGNRLQNQSILNYLLIELRKDKNELKFLKILDGLIRESSLKNILKIIFSTGIFKSNNEPDISCNSPLPLLEGCPAGLAVKGSSGGLCAFEHHHMVVRSCSRTRYLQKQQIVHSNDVSADLPVHHPTAEITVLPPVLTSSNDFTLLKTKYNDILRSFPGDHQETLAKLLDKFTDDQICEVLNCTDADSANKVMLDFLINNIKCREDLLDFCDQLDKLTYSLNLLHIVKEFRKELAMQIQEGQCDDSSRHSDSAEPENGSLCSELKPWVANAFKCEKHKSIIMKHYTSLCKALPADHSNVMTKLLKINIPNEAMELIISSDNKCEAIIDFLIVVFASKDNKDNMVSLCDFVEMLIEDPSKKYVTESLRHDFLSDGDQLVVTTTISTGHPSHENTPSTQHSQKTKNPISTYSTGVTQEPHPATEPENGSLCSELKPWVANAFKCEKHKSIIMKHYTSLCKALPADHSNVVTKLLEINIPNEAMELIISSDNKCEAIIDFLIVVFANMDKRDNMVSLCDFVEMLIEDPSKKYVTESLRHDFLSDGDQLVVTTTISTGHPSHENTLSTQHSQKTKDPISTYSTGVTQEPHPAKQSKTPLLDTFDHYLPCMMMIDPDHVKSKFISYGFFPNGDPLAGGESLLNNKKMEIMLSDIRKCIAINGEEMFCKLVAIFQSQGIYDALGEKLLDYCKTLGVELNLDTHRDSENEGDIISDEDLLEKLKWHRKQSDLGLLYQPAKPLPPNYIPRVQLLEDISKALLSCKTDNTVGTTVTVLGWAGFGKTTLAKALCHQKKIKQYFHDGFLWISLGQRPQSSEMKLIQIYNQLTNKQSDNNNISIEEKLHWYVANHLQRLLVIIDDVWDPHDAKIYAEIFSSCKIILTTRSNNISIEIPAKVEIKAQEMSTDEAMTLLTNNAVDIESLNSSERLMLETLAMDLHRWPLLLSLVRCQLQKHTHLQLTSKQALRKVQQTLYSKGLTAFDNSHASRENAVKASINATLDMLDENELSNLKTVVLYVGFGVHIPKSILKNFWNGDVEACAERFWSYGLVTLTTLTLAPSKAKMSCIEMHAVITQYLVDNMNFGTFKQIVKTLRMSNMKTISWLIDSTEEPFIIDMDDTPSEPENNENIVPLFIQLYIGLTDTICIPLIIQKLVVVTKLTQQEVIDKIELFSEHFQHTHPHLYSLLMQFDKKNNLKSIVGRAYKSFIQTYKAIKPLLRYDEMNHELVIMKLKNFLEDHPVEKIDKEFSDLIEELIQQCIGDKDAIKFIRDICESDNEEIGLLIYLPYLEHYLRLRHKCIELLHSNCDNIVTFWETIIEVLVNTNPDIESTLSKLQSLETKNDDLKSLNDNTIHILTQQIELNNELKQFLAIHFKIDQAMPATEFFLEIVRSHMKDFEF